MNFNVLTGCFNRTLTRTCKWYNRLFFSLHSAVLRWHLNFLNFELGLHFFFFFKHFYFHNVQKPKGDILILSNFEEIPRQHSAE